MKKTQTLAIAGTRPRNPLVVAARFRRAGSHRPRTGGACRQALRRELARLHPPHYP